MGDEICPKMEFNLPYNYAWEDHVPNSKNIHFINCKEFSYVSRNMASCDGNSVSEYGETVFIKGLCMFEKVLNKSLVYDVSIKTFTVNLDKVGSYITKCKFQK